MSVKEFKLVNDKIIHGSSYGPNHKPKGIKWIFVHVFIIEFLFSKKYLRLLLFHLKD